MAMKKLAAVSGDTNSAVLSERMRVSAILESPEGKRNPTMATELALRTPLDAEQARAILAQAPAANPYLAAMAKEGPLGIEAETVNMTEDAKSARLKEISAGVKAFNESRYPKMKTEG